MDPATRSSVVPVTLTDSSSLTREATEESRTETATLAPGQVAKSTSGSTVTPVSTKPLSYVEHTQAVDSESGAGSSSQVDPTPPATRSTSDPALQTLQRHLSSNTDGPYPDRCSRHGAPTFSGEFDHLARGTSRAEIFSLGGQLCWHRSIPVSQLTWFQRLPCSPTAPSGSAYSQLSMQLNVKEPSTQPKVHFYVPRLFELR
ncbi:hypothetical protein DFJ58DRAFT_270307 [Suillus subalutaceus]|uniref:uncharacterized protein n=1 Tax=Suillus subalutaceus TaxID=48586 RepID=UPI001B863566|nr:uncharacterized protein DFJ58DRAFT_270307 [Suillus subalutaceus]KAG1860679.1 hypothetical protein DFJ58DRAFT_270307 [Suillus subalutaceus]